MVGTAASFQFLHKVLDVAEAVGHSKAQQYLAFPLQRHLLEVLVPESVGAGLGNLTLPCKPVPVQVQKSSGVQHTTIWLCPLLLAGRGGMMEKGIQLVSLGPPGNLTPTLISLTSTGQP